jgi:hypothetical protein
VGPLVPTGTWVRTCLSACRWEFGTHQHWVISSPCPWLPGACHGPVADRSLRSSVLRPPSPTQKDLCKTVHKMCAHPAPSSRSTSLPPESRKTSARARYSLVQGQVQVVRERQYGLSRLYYPIVVLTETVIQVAASVIDDVTVSYLNASGSGIRPSFQIRTGCS